jgi:hypothetical protein
MTGQVPLLGQLINKLPFAAAGETQAGAAAPSGLQGLFAYLLQGGIAGAGLPSAEGGETDLFSALFSAEELSASPAGQGEQDALLNRLTRILDDLAGALEQEGGLESFNISVISIQVQRVMVTMQQAGVDVQQAEDAAQLAQAFETLGMPSQEAQVNAARIELALATMNAFKNQSMQMDLAQFGSLSGLEAQTSLSRTTVEIFQVQKSQVYTQQGSILAQRAAQAPVLDIAEKIQLDLPLKPDVSSAGGEGLRLALGQQRAGEGEIDVPLPANGNARLLMSLTTGQERADDVSQRPLSLDFLARKRLGTEQAQTIEFSGFEEEGFLTGQRTVAGEILAQVKPAGGVSPDAVEGFKPLEAMAERVERVERRENTPALRRAEAPAPLRGVTVYRLQPTNTGADVLTKVNELPLVSAAIDQANSETLELVDGIRSEQGSENRTSFSARVTQFARAANVGLQAQPVIKALAEQGGGQVRVTLRPAELGEIEIDLRVHEGRVQGTIAAQNPEVIEQLARELQILKQGLTDAGYQLGDEGLAFMLSQDGDGGTGGQDHEQENSLLAEQDDLDEEKQVSGDWINPERMVDVKI